ncbi:hypothetical protein [Agarivorans sp. DSG3-1]|uniref:hypothetical protein n=1 Tax=Agarivorans sp. DSG3-1 TaxID=3342249 RepID=UPI00398F2A54
MKKLLGQLLISAISLFYLPFSMAESSWEYRSEYGFFGKLSFSKKYESPVPKDYKYWITLSFDCGYSGKDMHDYYGSSPKLPYLTLSGHDVEFFYADGVKSPDVFGYNYSRIGGGQVKDILEQKVIVVRDIKSGKQVQLDLTELPELVEQHSYEINECYTAYQNLERELLVSDIKLYGGWFLGLCMFVLVFVKKFHGKTMFSRFFAYAQKQRQGSKEKRFQQKVSKRVEELEIEEQAKEKLHKKRSSF